MISKYNRNFTRRLQIKQVRGGFLNRQKLKTYISAALFFYSLNLKKRAVNLTRKNPKVVSKSNFYSRLVSSNIKYSLDLLKVRKLIKFKKLRKQKQYLKIGPVFWSPTLFNFHNLKQSLTVKRNKSYTLFQRTTNKLKNLILRSLPVNKKFNKLTRFANTDLISFNNLDINYFSAYIVWLNYVRLNLNIKNNFYTKLYQLYIKPLKFRRLKKKFKFTKFLKLRGKKTHKLLLKSKDLFFYDLHRSRAVRSLKVYKPLKSKKSQLTRYNYIYFYNSRKNKRFYTFEKYTSFKSWKTISAVLKKKRSFFLRRNRYQLKFNLKRKFYRFKKKRAKFSRFRRLTVKRKFKRGLRFIPKLLKLRKVKIFLKPFLKLRRHKKSKRALRRKRVKLLRKRNKKLFLKIYRRKIRKLWGIKVVKRANPFKKVTISKNIYRATSLKRTKSTLRKADRKPFKFKKWRSYRVQRRLLRFKKVWEGYFRLQEIKKNQKQIDFKIFKNKQKSSRKFSIKYSRRQLLKFLKISKKVSESNLIDFNMFNSSVLNNKNSINLLKVSDRLLKRFIFIKNKDRLTKIKLTLLPRKISRKLYQSVKPVIIVKKELSKFLTVFENHNLYNIFNDKLTLLENKLKNIKIGTTYYSLLIQNPIRLFLKGLTFIRFYLEKIKTNIENLRLQSLLSTKKQLYNLKVDSEIAKKQKIVNRKNFKKFILKISGLNPKPKIKKVKKLYPRKNPKFITKLSRRREKRLGFIKRHQFRYLKSRSRIFRERTDIWLQPLMVVNNFKNLLIKKGHSFSAEKTVNNLELIVKFNQKTKRLKKDLDIDSILPWFLSRFRPIFGVKPRRRGSAIIQIPMLLNSKRSASTGHREFIRLTNKRQERRLEDRLLNELIGTIENRSSTHKALTENLKLTFSNRVLL